MKEKTTPAPTQGVTTFICAHGEFLNPCAICQGVGHNAVFDEAAAVTPTPPTEPAKLAQRFHELYEALAPTFGYETRKESAKPWAEVPEQNKHLMIAVCEVILSELKMESDLRLYLSQALRQWRMYANENDGRELETCPSEEGQIYRAAQAVLAAAPVSTSVPEPAMAMSSNPLERLTNEQLSDVQRAVRDCYDRDLYRMAFEDHMKVCPGPALVVQTLKSAEPVNQELKEALRQALDLIFEHHEIGFIRRAYEQGAGSCELCKDGRLRDLAAVLDEVAERALSGEAS